MAFKLGQFFFGIGVKDDGFDAGTEKAKAKMKSVADEGERTAGRVDAASKKAEDAVSRVSASLGAATGAIAVFTIFLQVGKKIGEMLTGWTDEAKQASEAFRDLAASADSVIDAQRAKEAERLTEEIKEIQAEINKLAAGPGWMPFASDEQRDAAWQANADKIDQLNKKLLQSEAARKKFLQPIEERVAELNTASETAQDRMFAAMDAAEEEADAARKKRAEEIAETYYTQMAEAEKKLAEQRKKAIEEEYKQRLELERLLNERQSTVGGLGGQSQNALLLRRIANATERRVR